MSKFKEWLDEDYSLGGVQKQAARFMRAQSPRDVGLPLTALVLHHAIKWENDGNKKKKLVELFDILVKIGG